MKLKFLYILVIAMVSIVVCSNEIERPSTEHNVYFRGTDYEVNVYKVFGRKDGNTMLIVGGIQGDEPGGFLSADLYADLKLTRGNMTVIPRANFKSIIHQNRGVDGDMNRRFHRNSIELEMDKVVSLINGYMEEADVFLHLHDGWGFHHPEYVSKGRNPERFGQSIIIDTDEFICDNKDVLHLKDTALAALKEINHHIENEKYHMHLFNTDTYAKNSKFPGMLKTATWYALREHCIPSFAVETSKNLPTVGMKIFHHNIAINAFMELFNIIPAQLPIFLIAPVFDYAMISINGDPVFSRNGDIINVNKFDEIRIKHIESNYNRGLSCDIVGYGDTNDYDKTIKIRGETRVIFRKDYEKIGEIYIKLKDKKGCNFFAFIIKINGSFQLVKNGETVVVKKGDILELLEGFGNEDYIEEVFLNFKGYVPPNIGYNDGNDKGYPIKIDSHFMTKF